METQQELRSTQFLKLYRKLEGLLEKRYSNKRVSSSSVVMEYLHDPDSAPCRADLDMCREIRNLLAHNDDDEGQSVVEPSPGVVKLLGDIVDYVQRPRLAADYGTPPSRILFAHPNDAAGDVVRRMLKMGYSHVPVRDRTGLVGVFSAGSVFAWLGRHGFSGIPANMRIGDFREHIAFGDARSEKYLFLPPDATLLTVRDAFERRDEPNNRLAVAFITEDGTRHGELIAMLTPWDVLKNA